VHPDIVAGGEIAGWTTAGLPCDHSRNSVVLPYAKVCVTGAPSIARSAGLLPPTTLIETPPFEGVVVNVPRKE